MGYNRCGRRRPLERLRASRAHRTGVNCLPRGARDAATAASEASGRPSRGIRGVSAEVPRRPAPSWPCAGQNSRQRIEFYGSGGVAYTTTLLLSAVLILFERGISGRSSKIRTFDESFAALGKWSVVSGLRRRFYGLRRHARLAFRLGRTWARKRFAGCDEG